MRLIDADELIEHLYACIENGRPLSCLHDLGEIIDYVEKMPTIDAVEVVRGKWVHKFGGYVNCSFCGSSPLLDGEREYVETNYCPNCGAEMSFEEA